jgi:acyl carrier protein
MTTFEKVQAMLAEQLNIDSAKITPDSEIIADLKADSLDVFQLLMSIEDEYQTTVPDDKAQELKKVSDVVAFIDSLKK